MSGKNAASRLADMKLKEVPGVVGAHLREHYNWQATSKRLSEFWSNYRRKYIVTGSIRPLFDTMGILFVSSYVIAYPQVCEPRFAVSQSMLAQLAGTSAPSRSLRAASARCLGRAPSSLALRRRR